MARPRLAIPACVLLVALSAAAASAGGATAPVNVTLSIASASWVDPAGCASGPALDFGTVQPGTPVVSNADCVVRFGATNDTASLRVRQTDAAGSTMWRAPSGGVDTSYGGGDGIPPRFDLGTGANDYMRVLLRARDGTIVAGGERGSDLVVARLLADGSPDPSFGTGGVGEVYVNAGINEQGWDLAILDDGSVVMVGDTDDGAQVIVARWTADGDLDPAWGTGGVMTFTVGSGLHTPRAAVAQPDGRIVVTGGYVNGAEYDIFVARLDPDGTLDSTFGTGGVLAPVDIGLNDHAKELVLLDDGRLAVGFHITTGASATTGFLMVTADGLVDNTFATSGVAEIADVGPGTNEFHEDLAIDRAGRFVALVQAVGAGWDYAAVRWLPDGSLDDAFGGDGIAGPYDEGSGLNDYASSLVLLPDGRPTLLGYQSDGTSRDALAMRFRADGSLDPTFGGDGRSAVIDLGGDDWITGGHLGPDGTLVLGGYSNVAGNRDLVTLRLGASTVPDYSGGVRDWDTVAPNDAMFAACLRAVSGGALDGGGGWVDDADNSCGSSDTDAWYGIPGSTTGALVARTAAPDSPGGADPQAALRFGVRTPAAQLPGSYFAPITFDVIAP